MRRAAPAIALLALVACDRSQADGPKGSPVAPALNAVPSSSC